MDVHPEILKLDIKMEWWLWRGYCTFNQHRQTYTHSPEVAWPWEFRSDPMDRFFFREDDAFPLVKPAIDIFGLPHRSRKQRGWYRVRTPAEPMDTHPCVQPSPRRSAADLPLDVVHLVAELGLKWSRPPLHHDFVVCASVCRQWSKILRPRLFHEPIFRSCEDFTRFFTLIRAPRSTVATHVHFPILTEALPGVPFLHHLSALRAMQGIDRRFERSLAKIIGPLPHPESTFVRSIHWQLPRALPRPYFRYIDTLNLQDLSFHSFADLLHLVRELADLKELRCTRVTWGGETALPLPSLSRKVMIATSRPDVYLVGCSAGRFWHAVLLASTPVLVHEDTHISELTRAIDGTLSDVMLSHSAQTQSAFFIAWRRMTPQCCSLHLNLYFAPGHDTSEGSQHVTCIALDFALGTAEWTRWIDWTAVAQLVSSFANVQSVVVSVNIERGSEDRMALMRHIYVHAGLSLRSRGIQMKISACEHDI